MLTTEAITSAVPLAEDMVKRNLTIIPVENTPLAALVKESIPAFNPNVIEGNYAFSEAVFNIEFTSNSSQPGTDIKPHDIVLDEIVPIIAESVRKSISHARTVVVPLVEDMVKRANEVFAGMSPSSLVGAEVVVFNPPAPFVNGVFENSISKYNDTAYESGFVLPFALPELTEEALLKLISTGSKELDNDVAEWLSTLEGGALFNVWHNFFMLKQTSSLHNFITGDKSGYGRSNISLPNLIIIHLLARNLFDNPPEGLEVNLQAYNEAMSTIRNITGARLYFENQDYYDEVGKRNILIRSIVGNKVIVNGEVYRKWIEDGGENEVLFGNSLVRNPVREASLLSEKKEALLAEWNRHCAIVSTTEATRKFIRVKEILVSVFRQQLLDDTDPQLNREAMLLEFNKQIQQINEGDLECLYTLSLKLICRARFSQTDAEEILVAINKISKENPKLDVREAAAVAVIEYIGCWIAQQLKVV